jgi:hypothetical protein
VARKAQPSRHSVCKSQLSDARLCYVYDSTEMDEKTRWRERARIALRDYFRKHRFLRVTGSIILILTGLFGFLISYGLLKLGVEPMWLRYPVSVVAAYGWFLCLVRLWVALERARFAPDTAEIQQALSSKPTSTGRHYSGSTDSWLNWVDVPGFDFFELDEGCLPVILIGVVVGLGTLLVVAVLSTPALLAEIFLDAFLVSALYRRLRIAARKHWLGTAIRRTWLFALGAAALLAIGGWCLEMLSPGSKSIGPAIEKLFH